MLKSLRPLLADRRRARSLAAASVTLAAAGIVLIRAPEATTAAPIGPAVVTQTVTPRAMRRAPRARASPFRSSTGASRWRRAPSGPTGSSTSTPRCG